MEILKGIIVPCVTPFDEDGEIDYSALLFNFKKWNETGVRGYMSLGSNGEFKMLSDDEALEVIRLSSEVRDSEKTFIAGVGRESLYQTLKFIDKVNKYKDKIDYYSVLTPSYFKSRMTDEAVIDYYTKIADYSEVPVLLYCAPSFANEVVISAEALRVLAEHKNLLGIKDTSKNMMETYMDVAGGRKDFEVVSGSMSTLFTCLDRGGHGGEVSAANYFPSECARVVELYFNGGRDLALAYYEKLQLLIKNTGAKASVAGVKATMNLMGYKGLYPRKPVLPVSGEEIEGYKEVIEKYGPEVFVN